MATLVVLMGFGRTFPKKIGLFSLIVFCGVVMVNLSHVGVSALKDVWMGAIPVLIAACLVYRHEQRMGEGSDEER